METMMWILVPLAAGNLICLLKLNFNATTTLKERSPSARVQVTRRGVSCLPATFLIAWCLSMIKFESMRVNWKLLASIKPD